MNSGLRDAAALAWRLRLALDGHANTSGFLLDSYCTERLAHVRAIIDHSVLLGKVICETDKAQAAAYAKDLRANRESAELPPSFIIMAYNPSDELDNMFFFTSIKQDS